MVVLQCECSIDCLSTYYSSSITIQYSKVAVQHSIHRIHYSTVACPNFKLERQHPPFKSTIVFLGLLIIYIYIIFIIDFLHIFLCLLLPLKIVTHKADTYNLFVLKINLTLASLDKSHKDKAVGILRVPFSFPCRAFWEFCCQRWQEWREYSCFDSSTLPQREMHNGFRFRLQSLQVLLQIASVENPIFEIAQRI